MLPLVPARREAVRASRSLATACAVALALAVVLAPPRAARAQSAAASTRLDRLMTRGEMERTGVARLAPAERAALERWLANYANIVALGARSAAESGNGLVTSSSAGTVVPGPSDAISPVPEGARRENESRIGITGASGALASANAGVGPSGAGRRLTATTEAPRAAAWRIPARETVTFVADDGSTVRLGDGSLWAVEGAARPAALAWRLGESVSLARRPGGADTEVVIGNATRGTQISARLLAVPSAAPGVPASGIRP